jgi:DNA polymerase
MGTPVEVVLATAADFSAWRRRARALLDQAVLPEHTLWRWADQPTDLFAAATLAADTETAGASGDAGAPPASRVTVPRRFLTFADLVICHADDARFALLYQLLWRLTRGGEPALLADASDPLVGRAERMAAQVRREIHKMRAFVRFRAVPAAAGAATDAPVYIAWFEPAHHILARVAPFFVERFAGQRWSILTPAASAHWDGVRLVLADGRRRGEAPAADALEDLWRRYYASIFNPARVNPRAMRSQMPKRYLPNLPEAATIPTLLATAGVRTRHMLAAGDQPPPPGRSRRRAAPAAGSGKDVSQPDADGGQIRVERAVADDPRVDPAVDGETIAEQRPASSHRRVDSGGATPDERRRRA